MTNAFPTAAAPSSAGRHHTLSSADLRALAERDWILLPGGELEAPRARALCPTCRRVGVRPLCLSCFRAERDHERKLVAARALSTASEARFQTSLPFEPVNRARLNQLRAERQEARTRERHGVGQYVDKRRQAQIAARHALQRLAEGLRARGIAVPGRHEEITDATRAADLQLPDSWLPFVASIASPPAKSMSPRTRERLNPSSPFGPA